ncbi:MAG: hypothetical protein AVDCRST_MAG05-4555, partial [uncultured Rubrobacteraceae bacterium]
EDRRLRRRGLPVVLRRGAQRDRGRAKYHRAPPILL